MDAFQIISKLGEGAYSTVFKVKRTIDGQIYALKKVKLLNLSDKEKENALNEVRILASVNSNFVVGYKEAFFDEKDNTLCIVMEFADGGDLYQKIVQLKKSAKFFEETEIWKIFIQLVKGLKALHDLKILHRDLKSANVFLYSNSSAKIGDLNVSKVAKRGLGYTQTGTPYYASPEVWKDKPYDNKSDIWSLGCVLYEMITLRPPFRAQNMEGLYNKVIKGHYSRIPDKFSNDLFTVVQFLLQVNPDSRPSCEQILNHPAVVSRIEFFKSVNGISEQEEEKNLLNTIHMPKNLLFLSDKLPKPNYENHLKQDINTKSYRSYRGSNDGNLNNENVNHDINNSCQSCSPPHLPVRITEEKKSIVNSQSDIMNNNNNKKVLIMPPINYMGIGGVGVNGRHIISRNLPSIRNRLIINKASKPDLVSLDIIAKQKNELSRLMLGGNNNLNKKLNYLNNNGKLNPSYLKDLYKIYPHLANVNKSLPQKQNNSNRYVRNKYYVNPALYALNERYSNNNSQNRGNVNDLIYNAKNHKIIINNIKMIPKEGPEPKILPKRKLCPIKK